MGKYPYPQGPKFAANIPTQRWRYPKHGRKLYLCPYIRDRWSSYTFLKHLMITAAMVIEYTSNTHRDRSLSQSILSHLESDACVEIARERLRFDPLRPGVMTHLWNNVTCRLSPSNKFDWNDSLSKNRKPTIFCEQRIVPDIIDSWVCMNIDKSHCSPSVRSDCKSTYIARKTKSTKIEAPLPKRASMPLKIYSKSMKTWLLPGQKPVI